MNTKRLIFTFILLMLSQVCVARSVCSGSTLEIKNGTPYTLTLVQMKVSSSAKLNIVQGDTIKPKETKTITIKIDGLLDLSGYTRGQMDFSFNEHNALYIYFNLMNTITRTPEFKCQAYKADAFVSDPHIYSLKVDTDPPKEEQPAHVHIGLYPAAE